MTAADIASKPAGLPPRPGAVSTCPWGGAGGQVDRLARKPPAAAAPTAIWGEALNQGDAVKKGPAPTFEGCAGSGAPKIGEGTPRRYEQPTCPWGARGEQPAKGRASSRGASPRTTCPWEGASGPTDRDSRVLADAEQRRNRGAVAKFDGCAGGGAPKPKPRQDLTPQSANGQNMNPQSANEYPEEDDGDIAQAALGENGGDNEHAEIRGIIDRCLENGLDRDQINEVLEEYQAMKMVEKKKEEQERTIRAPPSKPQQMSVAAQRQNKMMAQHNGPSDQEIGNILLTHTPPETPDGVSSSLVEKRNKARNASEASVASYQSDKSRAAYVQSQQDAAIAKNKNRLGSGIF